jgi:hypothetical protein
MAIAVAERTSLTKAQALVEVTRQVARSLGDNTVSLPRSRTVGSRGRRFARVVATRSPVFRFFLVDEPLMNLFGRPHLLHDHDTLVTPDFEADP